MNTKMTIYLLINGEYDSLNYPMAAYEDKKEAVKEFKRLKAKSSYNYQYLEIFKMKLKLEEGY